MKYSSHLPADMPETFMGLNMLYPLKPIADSVDLENATEVMDRLAVLDKPTKDQRAYLDTLVLLIEAYEKDHQPKIDTASVTGLAALKLLMGANGMKQSELAELLGISAGAVSMILSGQREITAEHARRLGSRFAVGPGLFI